MTDRIRPLVLVTAPVHSRGSDPGYLARRTQLYLQAIRRAGGDARTIDETSGRDERRAAFAAMDALLLSGGGDIDPARYGRAVDGSREIERGRDELEEQAWAAAENRNVPVLGICRGLQAVNAFSGGTLTQHVDDHAGLAWGRGIAATHPIRIDTRTRVGGLLAAGGFHGGDVNTFHHQAVAAADLGPGLVPVAWADSPVGPVVEILEGSAGRWVAAVQCHPERTDSTPPAFERLFASFVEAALIAREAPV
ncbi:MAG TPA: gamma-glutamyl-gamma-aminobutyrate hydrolase family protein [Candidatus Limnocylindrales bacterium]